MKPEEKLPQDPAEDRAALREELLRTSGSQRVQVFDALNREADAEEEVPDMPPGLRDQLVEQFGKATPATPAPTRPDSPSLLERVVELFRAKPAAAFGGLAVAACAVMFAMVQFGDTGDGGGKGGQIDNLRGGSARPAATADVPIFLFPESKAAGIVPMMAGDRKVVLCADQADFEKRLDVDWAVAVDLDRRVILSFEEGKASGETPVDGEGDRGVLLGVRAALDQMVE